MTLREAVVRRDHGAKFHSSSQTLDAYCRQVGPDRGCNMVGVEEVHRFLAGKGTLTRTHAVKYGTLSTYPDESPVRCLLQTMARRPGVADADALRHACMDQYLSTRIILSAVSVTSMT